MYELLRTRGINLECDEVHRNADLVKVRVVDAVGNGDLESELRRT